MEFLITWVVVVLVLLALDRTARYFYWRLRLLYLAARHPDIPVVWPVRKRKWRRWW